ncbi:MAG: hypothetical protein E6X23_17250 [Mixta calida]|jgi:hypothetical protein|uniref:hypothetical protein n=1 Tax=Mixta calida TaxID=665913 RepID=UPI0012E94A58|nr:hypothetical protein [Mixta calida]MBS6058885.1 hypothetical protein [Pantoea sp.]MCR1568343.1 hypothetical protein [Mixta sp.]KAF0858270.1 hypothetical protein Y888_17415 [Mixta calida B021323]MDU3818285.1 hypothetical protein [Pantoea sp.]MDU4290661.1 hypothetical protein [Mixta calida]
MLFLLMFDAITLLLIIAADFGKATGKGDVMCCISLLSDDVVKSCGALYCAKTLRKQ